jgi:hypothetical protein
MSACRSVVHSPTFDVSNGPCTCTDVYIVVWAEGLVRRRASGATSGLMYQRVDWRYVTYENCVHVSVAGRRTCGAVWRHRRKLSGVPAM